MTVEEAEAQAEAAEAQAEAEGLTLQRSENQTGYVGVYVNTSNKVKPFEARVRRGGQRVFIGHFATAEEAALEVALVRARVRVRVRANMANPDPDPTLTLTQADYAALTHPNLQIDNGFYWRDEAGTLTLPEPYPNPI